MIVLVCGGRNFNDREGLLAELDRLHAEHGFSQVVHGAACGADSLAGEWGEERGVPVRPFPADWNGLGRKAGPIRNQRMLVEGRPDLVVAFPGGRGTHEMVQKSTAAGVRVIEIPKRTSAAQLRQRS